MSSIDLVLPDLGIDDQPITVSLWLVKRGGRVAEGEQILEILSGSVTVDLPAPVDGVLVKKLVEEGDAIEVGQRLGIIESRAD